MDLQGFDYVYNFAGQLRTLNLPNIGTTNTSIYRDPDKDSINSKREVLFGLSINHPLPKTLDIDLKYINNKPSIRNWHSIPTPYKLP